MDIYNQVQTQIKSEEIKKKEAITLANFQRDIKYNEVCIYLKSLGLDFRVEWSGWFIRLEIDIVKGSESKRSKAHIKIMPQGKLIYCCCCNSVNRYKGNEILTEETKIQLLEEIKPLVIKDIKNSTKSF